MGHKLVALAVVALMVVAVVLMLIDWKRTVGAILIAILLASMLYLPAFGYFAITTRSVRESFSRSWEWWKQVASEVFSHIN